ncbi:MAG: cupin domain-containing protein [Nibricoccus sp.]
MAEKPLFGNSQVSKTALTAETVYAENGVVSRTLLATAATRVVLFAFAEGQSLSEHSTPRAALVQIVTGSCEFAVNDTLHQLTAGDLLYMPPGAPHSVRASERFSMLLTLSKDEPSAKSTK